MAVQPVLRFTAMVGVDRKLMIDLPPETPMGEVHVVIELGKQPTRAELLAMPVAEREHFLSAQADLLAELYQSDLELTTTAEMVDLYDYPDE